MTSARGLRNNNPGNIERNAANAWQGRMPPEHMTPAQAAEARFEVFSSPTWGIRALAVLLINYADRHGCDTVAKIITRWAPTHENDRAAYIAAVAQAVSVEPTAPIDPHTFAVLRPLVEAIITHENGKQPYPPETIEEGLRLAGVVKPGVPLIAPARSVDTAVAAAAATGGVVAVVEVTQQISTAIGSVLPAVQQVNAVAVSTAGLPAWVRAAVSLAVVGAAAASLYGWWKLRRARRAAA
ncbi:MAG: hypothetical protein KDA35_10875 [Hyphomonadaceae bacterium]|nr:hypothetical protein [Hyphomonadaceae bacterium]